VTDTLIILRSVHIAATVLAAGTVCFMVLVAAPAFGFADGAAADGLRALRRRWNLIVWIALAVAILSGLAWLAVLAADIYGAPLVAVCLHGGLWSVLSSTRFGLVWTVRLALALLLCALLLRPAARAIGLAQLGAAAGLIALLAFVGHAGAKPGPAGELHLASDIVHLVAAGAWLGGLPALAMLLSWSRQGPEPALRDIAVRATSRFSVLGMLCVAALLASGLVNSWNLLGGPRDLIGTDYGRLVLLKAALFIAMVGIAAVNRFHLTPRIAAAGARRALARNSLAEAGLGLCVIVFVGALGTMAPTAHVHVGPPDIPPAAAFTHIHTNEAMADVTIDPGRSGRVKATIRVLREDFSQFAAKAVQLTLDPPVAGLAAISRIAVHMPDGSWQIDGMDIPQRGIWTVRVTITADGGPPIVLDAPIVIER